jgi:hypothetical protein
MSTPALVISIDTEEEGLWSNVYRPVGNSCRNVMWLPRLHQIFTRLGVKPTYLVDYPVVTDRVARSILGELAAGGASEIGAHLHPWCTPPLERGDRGRVTYPHLLPPDVQQAKLETLCAAIASAFGVRPTSYRAGRWGFDASTVPVLERLGFAVDTSVRPLWWDRGVGAPSFRRAPVMPYRLDGDDASCPGASRVVEVPVSSAFVGPLPALWARAAAWVPAAPGMRWALERLGLRSLLPEQQTLPEMCTLVDALVARGVPVLNVMFHSTTAMPGATPFVRDRAQLARFVARVEGLLEHIRSRHDAQPLGLSEVPAYVGLAITGTVRAQRASM